MKILIIYFSLGGRTKSVAEGIASKITDHDVKMESFKLNGRFQTLMKKIEEVKAGDLSDVEFNPDILDVSAYDMIYIGMPTWGGQPAPVYEGYMSKAMGFEGKNVIVFAMMRFFPGKVLDTMKSVVEEKGARVSNQAAVKGLFRISEKKVENAAQNLKI